MLIKTLFGDYFLPCALVHAEEPIPFSHSEPLSV